LDTTTRSSSALAASPDARVVALSRAYDGVRLFMRVVGFSVRPETLQTLRIYGPAVCSTRLQLTHRCLSTASALTPLPPHLSILRADAFSFRSGPGVTIDFGFVLKPMSDWDGPLLWMTFVLRVLDLRWIFDPRLFDGALLTFKLL